MSKLFEGIVPPIITPFDEDEELSEDRTRKLVDFLIDGGVHGIYACGSIGELSNLTTEEMRKVEEIVIDASDGRVPVLAGTGASGTKEAVERTKNAEDIGADGVMTVTTFYLTSDQEGMKEHYRRIANSTDLPVLLYHIPQCTHQQLDVETISWLEKEYDNIVGMKDSSGDLARAVQIIRKTSDDFIFFQGSDRLLMPTLVLGSDGGVSGTANVEPAFTVGVFEKCQEGEIEEAKEIQLNKIEPLADACTVGPFPANFKSASNLTGLDLGPARSPIRSLNEEELAKQKQMLDSLGLLEK